MKKLALIMTLIVVFTIGTLTTASAKPGKSNHGQDKKLENIKINHRDVKVNPGQSKKSLPSVIKIGRFQLPVNPIVKDLKASVNWAGGNVITITKGTTVITITITANGKKTTEVTITSTNSTTLGTTYKKLTQKGNGVINPTSYIKSLLKATTQTPTDSGNPVATFVTQTVVKGGTPVIIQSTKTGTAYLVNYYSNPRDVDTVAELNALVLAGKATNAPIDPTNLRATIPAPNITGVYAVVIDYGAGNVSAIKAATIKVEASSQTDLVKPVAAVLTPTVQGGASVIIQSSETGTAYLVDNTLASIYVDTVTELEALVAAGTATKAPIDTTSLRATITAPNTSRVYSVVVTDTAGNVSVISSSTTVTVNATVDTIAPIATLTPPTPGNKTTIVVTFNEALNASTLAIRDINNLLKSAATTDAQGNPIVISVASVAGSVTWSGTSAIITIPSTVFSPNRVLRLYFKADAVKDLAGNAISPDTNVDVVVAP